ncbi:MAG: hypothetical protein ABIF10_07125 [Candidatus Woesearchaeota archaeon]
MAEKLNKSQRRAINDSITDAVTGLSNLQNRTLPDTPKDMFKEQEKIIKKLVDICESFGSQISNACPELSQEFREHMINIVTARESCDGIARQVKSCNEVQLSELQTLVNFAEIRQKLQQANQDNIELILQSLNESLQALADVSLLPEIKILKPEQGAELDKAEPNKFVFEAEFRVPLAQIDTIVFGLKDSRQDYNRSLKPQQNPTSFITHFTQNGVQLLVAPAKVAELVPGKCIAYFEIAYGNQKFREQVEFEVISSGKPSVQQDELQRKIDEILTRLNTIPARIQAIVDAKVGTATDEIRRLLRQMKSEQAAQLDKNADSILKAVGNVSKKTGDIENLVQKLIAEQDPKKLKSLLDDIKKEIISNVSQQMSALQNALSSLSTKGDVEGLLATLQEVNKEQETLMKGLQDVLQEVGKLSEQNREGIEQQTKQIVGMLRTTYYNRVKKLEQLLKAILNNRPALVSIYHPKLGREISPPTLQVRGAVRGPHPQYIIICAIYGRSLLASSQQTVVSGGVRFTSSMDISRLQPGNCTLAVFAIPPGISFVLPQKLEESTVFAAAIGITIGVAGDLLELQKLKDDISSEEQELIEIEDKLKGLLDNELNNDNKLVQELASFVKPLVSADPRKVFTIAGIAKEVDKNILSLTGGLKKFEESVDAQVKRLAEREGKIVFREHEDMNKLAEQIKNHFLQGRSPSTQQSVACMNAAKWLQAKIGQRNLMLDQVVEKLKELKDLHVLMLQASTKIHRSVTTSPPNIKDMLNAVNELSSLVLGETNKLEDVRKMLSEITYLTKSIDGPSKLRELINAIVGQAPPQTQ